MTNQSGSVSTLWFNESTRESETTEEKEQLPHLTHSADNPHLLKVSVTGKISSLIVRCIAK